MNSKQLQKNLLDLEHSRLVSYFETSTVILATPLITGVFSPFLYSNAKIFLIILLLFMASIIYLLFKKHSEKTRHELEKVFKEAKKSGKKVRK